MYKPWMAIWNMDPEGQQLTMVIDHWNKSWMILQVVITGLPKPPLKTRLLSAPYQAIVGTSTRRSYFRVNSSGFKAK